MDKKVFYPLAVHICMCLVCYFIFRLTWMSPEGGFLLQYLPENIYWLIFSITCALQIFVSWIYFYIGRRISSFSITAITSISNIAIINMVCVVILCLLGNNIMDSLRLFVLFGGASFFLLCVVSEMNIIVNVLIVFLPTIIIFLGNTYGYFKYQKSHQNNNDINTYM